MYLEDQELQLPRLTGTLRAFSNVSKKYEDFDKNVDRQLIKRKKDLLLLLNQQKQQPTVAAANSFQALADKIQGSSTAASRPQTVALSPPRAWSDVLLKLVPKPDDQKYAKLKASLEKLRTSVTKHFLNEDFNDTAMLNEAAYFIMETFAQFYDPYKLAGHHWKSLDKLQKRLHEKFGRFARNHFETCRELMNAIFDELERLDKISCLDELFGSREGAQVIVATTMTSAAPQAVDASPGKMFGESIKFVSYFDPKNASLFEESSEDESDEADEEEDDTSDDVLMKLPPAAPAAAHQSASNPQDDALRHLKWTQNLSPEMCNIVYEMLCKKAAPSQSAELQNELLELLGFDNIETIEYIFSNREEVVKAYKLYLGDDVNKKSTLLAGKQASVVSKTGPIATAVTSEIMVQTESEKRIRKLMLKEEKRLGKMRNAAQIENEIGENFDPATLRQLREEQLIEARILQLYHQKKLNSLTPASFKKTEQYPFVFDSMLKIAQTTAFIAGSKILLPENISRLDTGTFDEIFIPASDPLDMAQAERYHNTKEAVCFRPLKKIAELDEIGQIAFRNVKSLNRIQSVVFDAAYNSNQNLLICAPTGAGKTNIAMLTIVNQISKNIVDGVLQKDKFKIVYVAPMKALAAEMVENFSKRLEPLGVSVRELTGDMQLTKQEISQTQMIVTTPEKWDVVTRKSTGDVSLSLLVRLLIIDEVHLLHDDRGSVIETIVARTLRQVESSQKMIRIVGLSATLPNYMDVARFLDVNPKSGLFFFDARFRPVPLAQTFIGVKSTNKMIQQQQMDEVCYDKALKLVKQGHQVMVFVHSRNATLKTILKLREMAKQNGDIEFFRAEQSKEYGDAQKQMSRSKNKQLKEVFDDGFAVHHAGMLRSDRTMVEKLFVAGHIRLLCCTATLAWGVNLPARAVIIKGTEVYDSKKGSFVDLSMLDILQIFGRAGRPQYDKSGEAFIITTHDRLGIYLSLLTRQSPIESQFLNSLADNLNAEVCLGSVTNVVEGSKWLSYTYLHVRMKFNPLAYGVTYKTLETDPGLELHRQDLIRIAARILDKARMVRFDEASGSLHATDLGRTASHYYIKSETIEMINTRLNENMSDKEILGLISECSEFQQLKVRDEEMEELDKLHEDCLLPVMGGIENTHGKVNCLIQSYISRYRIDGFSLVSDMAYVAQNVTRIARALFEVTIKKGWPLMSGRLLNVCKSIEKQLWHFQNPMRQFENQLTYEIAQKIEERDLTIDKLRDMDSKELGIMLRHPKMGDKVKEFVSYFPVLEIETSLHPITRTVLRVKVTLTPDFRWHDKYHGVSEFFWVWIEDPVHNHIYHYEFFNLLKKHVKTREPQLIVFTIPIFEPLPSQYIVRVISDRWLGVEFSHSISFKHLILPEVHPPHTELLDLDPLPVTALKNPKYEALYPFTHFNPIQTQIFHCYYHTDNNSLLGAPTGSGKTIAAELALFRVFNQTPKKKCVYIAPLKALVRERMIDWKVRLEQKLGKKVVELTGDVAPDMKIVAESDVIVTTPEKWDGISRSWQTRNYVKDVALIIIDEIHLLGEDRGPVLEVIISRTNFISSHTNLQVRVIGLSTALANARDLADWLGIKNFGLYNFKPSVRPVPLEVHIQAFPGKFYCPRMATMNKPCFQEIKIHSPTKPVLIFVSSRRQTRLTALDLMSCLAAEPNPKQWMHISEDQMEQLISQVHDQNLKLTLAFGIALHHAGLGDKDRKLVEELFVNQKIQVLIATSTLAWGVNFPAHLVIVKGTEYYDGKTKQYADFPITDVLQMMGRAGRPQFDDQGVAVIMVHDVKKHFYKKFLYEPFPVESSLLGVLSDHLNAEIVASTISTRQEAIEYLTWTYFFTRLLVNPSYYQLESLENDQINRYLSRLIQKCLDDLEASHCIEPNNEDGELVPTTLGRIASFYYLSHFTLKQFADSLKPDIKIEDLIDVLASAYEFDELPVRHNEDKMNQELSYDVPLPVNSYSFESPHCKCNLLLQAHFCRIPLPCSDYLTDTKSVLDQCLRVMQAMLDLCADRGWLQASIQVINLIQMCCQGRWLSDSELTTMPHIETDHLARLYHHQTRIDCLPMLIDVCEKSQYSNVLEKMLGDLLDQNQIREIYQTVGKLPQIEVNFYITGNSIAGEGDSKADRKESARIKLNPSGNQKTLPNLIEDEEYVLNVELRVLNKRQGVNKREGPKAYAPKYPKPKDENWIVVLGSDAAAGPESELLAMKRMNSLKSQVTTTHLTFSTPKRSGQFNLSFFLMSDVYLGLDQQYDFKFNLIQKK